ncbi:endonuclease/exonuclease/phosphatase family protein, partial [Mycolicibacterium porcinum]|uniref:endonuclease/exonuclease/phosphatase family protein n=1 Tax=Mycolicibacterium porcinum TaxID=39693 RepID=UPI0034D02185
SGTPSPSKIFLRRQGTLFKSDRPGPLSWWSWAGESFVKDVGWRIDHHLATPRLARTAVSVTVDKEPTPGARLSDHAPVVVRYAFP